ncbi:MAG: CHAT domain-containing protein [Pyrinomonadaceae bacterium]
MYNQGHMTRAELANRLIAATEAERGDLLADNARLADTRLADEIRAICHATWTSEPVTAQRAADVMRILARVAPDEGIKAIAAWVNGIANITKGKFESAVESLDHAAGLLDALGRHHDAAQTQMAKLLALGMLGRYPDAVAAGEKARAVFLKNGDELAAGKIEVNLANVVSRSGAHHEAERYCLAARRRFVKLGEKELQAVAENGLANTYSELNEFAKADRYYRMALETARGAGMHVTEAEIEASIGSLAQVRGRYADALKFLELSREKYESLKMPHQSAIADLEIADLYAELNLGTEALATYERVTSAFSRLKMRGEEARARLNYGRTAAIAGDAKKAERQFALSLKLYALEKNHSGRASAMLAQARLAMENGDTGRALVVLRSVHSVIGTSENPRDRPAANWLEGETQRRACQYTIANQKLVDSLNDARRLRLPDLEQATVNSLGKLSFTSGDLKGAETYFKKAIKLIEKLRGPLASEEFSMSFLASRLEPYDQLARLYLDTGRVSQAFRTIESGRSRSLLDAMARGGNEDGERDGRNIELDQVRTELNAYYKRLDRADDDEIADLRRAVAERETQLARLTRQIASLGVNGQFGTVRSADDPLKALARHLGKNKTLVEYVEIDGVISAFVVTGKKVQFVRGLANVEQIASLLDDLHFQFGTLRYGIGTLERFRDEMRRKADSCLAGLYELLLAPIEDKIAGGRLVIVPAGVVHYVPFPALRGKDRYLIERFEISVAPSASVWSRLQEQGEPTINRSLLMAFADERIPMVETEVAMINKILPGSRCLTGKNASFSAFARNAGTHDLIHLACHGQFRAENPMFSSLHLADGWITVHDICSRSITAGLVTLSACETGLSKVFAGDEILGLARGFLTAGAGSLIVSLWTVNDRAAGELMAELYTLLQRGKPISSSLRDAQLLFIRRGDHPYLWSPFVLIGR